MVRVSLRLDDGSLISQGSMGEGAVKISLPRALELHRAGEKEVQRLEQLLATARSLAPRANGEPHFTPLVGGAKRPRVDSGHITDVSLLGDWISKCKTIVERLGKSFGPDKVVFWNPVDPKLLPDYYTIIKNPMFFGSIQKNLTDKRYQSPAEFAADVRLAFDNCKLYNPVNDPFRKKGEKVEAEFEQLWVASGLSEPDAMDARGKRMSAGLARQKFAETADEVGKAKQEPGGKGPRPTGKSKAGGEATSGGRGGAKEAPVSDQRKQEMGELLTSDEMGPHMEALTQLLPPELLENADGEFELDFETLDDATVRKIDVFLRGIFGPPAGGDGGNADGGDSPASGGGAQDDDDEVSEGDLDDADESDD